MVGTSETGSRALCIAVEFFIDIINDLLAVPNIDRTRRTQRKKWRDQLNARLVKRGRQLAEGRDDIPDESKHLADLERVIKRSLSNHMLQQLFDFFAVTQGRPQIALHDSGE